MNGLRNSNFQENEIVKASDVQLVGDVAIENLGKALKTLFGSSKNVVIGGKLTAYTGGSGLMAKMDPILGISTASEIPFSDHEGKFYSDGDTEPSSYITFASAGSSNRRDLVEVKADTITAVEQSRQFYDPETETTSYAQTDTEKRTVLRLKVKKGTNGSDTCPTTDSGYVKLAEVKIPANATSLSNSYIFNVTADIEGIDNTGWTAEKQVTINPGTLKDISTKFRAIHNSDGSLKDSVIAAAKIILSGSGALQGSAIQKGGSAEEIDGENVTASNSISTFFAKIAAKLRKVADKPTEVTQAEYDALKAAGKVEGKYFIITDAVGTEQPLIRDDLKNTTTVWSSSKTNTTINNALADLSKLKNKNVSSLSDCIPSEVFQTELYEIRTDAINGTISNFIIESRRTKHPTLDINMITQTAYQNRGDVNKAEIYTRNGHKTSSTEWLFSSWQKLATDSDVNGALADLGSLKYNTIDFQTYIQTNQTKYITFGNAVNVPLSNGVWIIESTRRNTDVIQIAKRLNNTTPDTYSRVGKISNDTITWSDWEIISVAKTTLDGALADYVSKKNVIFGMKSNQSTSMSIDISSLNITNYCTFQLTLTDFYTSTGQGSLVALYSVYNSAIQRTKKIVDEPNLSVSISSDFKTLTITNTQSKNLETISYKIELFK